MKPRATVKALWNLGIWTMTLSGGINQHCISKGWGSRRQTIHLSTINQRLTVWRNKISTIHNKMVCLGAVEEEKRCRKKAQILLLCLVLGAVLFHPVLEENCKYSKCNSIDSKNNIFKHFEWINVYSKQDTAPELCSHNIYVVHIYIVLEVVDEMFFLNVIFVS